MKHPGLLPSLPSLLPLLSNKTRNSIMENCWEGCLSHLGLRNENLQILPNNIKTTDKYAFGILDGYVWKIKLEEDLSKINLPFQNFEDVNENFYYHFDNNFRSNKETCECLDINLFNPHMDKIHELFQKVSDSRNKYKQKLNQNDQNLIERNVITYGLLQVWKIKIINQNKIMLRVFKRVDVNSKWELTCTKISIFKVSKIRKIKLLEIELFTDDDIIIITTIGLLIYHFNENEKSIFLKYWNYMELTEYTVDIEEKSVEKFDDLKTLLRPYYYLPYPSYYSFKTSDEWISYVKDNNESLLIYGVGLLEFAIKKHKLELIEEIYKKCITLFKEDLGNNRMFLSIITSAMPLLNEYYPEYVLRYSLETTMIIDRPFYSIEYQHDNLHLYSFQYLQLVDLTRSILYLKYNVFLFNHDFIYVLLYAIQVLMTLGMFLLFPLFFIYVAIFYILSKYHFISNILTLDYFSYFYYFVFKRSKTTPTITFMVPYIKFVNYPKYYKWYLELFMPQYSPFVKTINRDIYKTWNGEAIINFKWNTYGIYYYSIIWIGFMFLLGCFTAAATIPQQYIDDDIRKKLFIASIIFGFIHLSFEIRQFIYDPIKWFRDFWNIFGT
jgi:hypothetical protein